MAWIIGKTILLLYVFRSEGTRALKSATGGRDSFFEDDIIEVGRVASKSLQRHDHLPPMIVLMIEDLEQNVGACQGASMGSPNLFVLFYFGSGQGVEIGIGGGTDGLLVTIETIPIGRGPLLIDNWKRMILETQSNQTFLRADTMRQEQADGIPLGCGIEGSVPCFSVLWSSRQGFSQKDSSNYPSTEKDVEKRLCSYFSPVARSSPRTPSAIAAS